MTIISDDENLTLILPSNSEELTERMEAAIEVLLTYGNNANMELSQWTINEALRKLTNSDYLPLIEAYNKNMDRPWSTGRSFDELYKEHASNQSGLKMTEEQYLFINFSVDWADEMNVYGYAIMTKEEWDKHLSFAKEFFKKYEDENDGNRWDRDNSWEVGIGTNEEVFFSSFDEWLQCFEVFNIKADTATNLLDALKEKSGFEYGVFISPLTSDTEEEEDDEDEDEITENPYAPFPKSAEEENDGLVNSLFEAKKRLSEQDGSKLLEALKQIKFIDYNMDGAMKRLKLRMHLKDINDIKDRTECENQIIIEINRILLADDPSFGL